MGQATDKVTAAFNAAVAEGDVRRMPEIDKQCYATRKAVIAMAAELDRLEVMLADAMLRSTGIGITEAERADAKTAELRAAMSGKMKPKE